MLFKNCEKNTECISGEKLCGNFYFELFYFLTWLWEKILPFLYWSNSFIFYVCHALDTQKYNRTADVNWILIYIFTLENKFFLENFFKCLCKKNCKQCLKFFESDKKKSNFWCGIYNFFAEKNIYHK